MSFSRLIQWYHSHVEPIWPDGTFKKDVYVLEKTDEVKCETGIHVRPQMEFFRFQIMMFLTGWLIYRTVQKNHKVFR